MTQRELELVSSDECFELLGRAHVGRLVYIDEAGPVAIPVNYALAGTDIVLRVEGGAKRTAMQQPTLAFEADYIDDDAACGWSVVVRGTGSEVKAEALPALLRRMEGQFPRPWAAGVHNHWLQITPQTVTGRRLGVPRVAPAI